MRSVVRRDDGSTLPLVIFYGLLGIVVVLLVTAATSLYLEKKRLLALADGAALVGAESFDLTDVSITPTGPRPALESSDVASAVAEYLDGPHSSRFEQLAIDAAFTPDGRSATVTLSAMWRPPVLTLFVPDGIRVDATATARSVFG
jgi:hypothetical protein